jgi:hypothetical protein
MIAASAGRAAMACREGTKRAGVLLLIVYLQGLSVANHLLALLVGPAVLGFILFTLRSAPRVIRSSAGTNGPSLQRCRASGHC